MAKVDWDKYVVHNASTQSKALTRPIDWDQYLVKKPPQDYGVLHNIGAGFSNPLINVANRALAQAHAIGHLGEASGLLPHQVEPVHHIDPIPHSGHVAYGIGDIGSYVLPFEAEMQGANLLTSGAEHLIPALGRLAERKGISTAGRVAKAGAVGAGTAIPLRDPDETVKSAALGGGIGGAAGETAGQLLRGVGAGLGKIGAREKLGRLFKKSVDTFNPIDPEDTSHDRMINTIAHHYLTKLNEVNPIYDKIFNAMDEKGEFMQPSDLKSYRHTIGDMSGRDRGKLQYSNLRSFIHPDLKAIDSLDVHKFKSELGNRMAKIGDTHPDYSTYARAREGLDLDLNTFLKKTGQHEEYDRARKIFKKNVGPFRDIRVFKNTILPNLEKAIDIEDGQKVYRVGGFKTDTPISRITKSLLPGPKDSTMTELNKLKTLMGGDIEDAKEHGRNVFYAQHFRRQPNGQRELDIPAFLKREEGLSDGQRDFLIPKEEQKAIDTLRRLNLNKLSAKQKTILQTGMGAFLGHAIGHYPKLGTIGGAIMGAPGFRALEKGAASLFSPNELDELVDFLNKKPGGMAAKGRGAVLGSYLGAQSQRGDNDA